MKICNPPAFFAEQFLQEPLIKLQNPLVRLNANIDRSIPASLPDVVFGKPRNSSTAVTPPQ